MDKRELQYEFELYKEGNISEVQLANWTDEMKWWLIENDKPLNRNIYGLETISNEMVIKGLKNGHSNLFIKDIIDTHDIPEEVYLDFIRTTSDKHPFLKGFVFEYSMCKNLQTHDIMLELALRQPYYIDCINLEELEFTKEDCLKIADVYFSVDNWFSYWKFNWKNDYPLDERHWKIIVKEHLNMPIGLISRIDCPHYLFEEWLKDASIFNILQLPNISGEDLYFYFEHNKNERYDDKYSNVCEAYFDGFYHHYKCNCFDLENLLKLDGSYIKYIKKPNISLCKAAIDNNPQNIQYIDVKANAPYLYALEKDQSVQDLIPSKRLTPTIRKFLGLPKENTNTYKSKYYLVKFDCDLCDESNLQKVCVVEGSKMEDFMDSEFILCFGNLCDDESKKVKDFATYTPITKEEYEILKKLKLDDMESGGFIFNIEE